MAIPVFYSGLFLAVIHFASIFILGPGKDPDTAFGAPEMAATLGIFLVWSLGILGWGNFFRKKFRLQGIGILFALGTLWACLVSLTLGHLGLIGPQSRWIFGILPYFGIFLGMPEKVDLRSLLPSKENSSYSQKLARGIWVFLGLIVCLRMLRALHPWGQSDPLFYQLLAPRIWIDHGKIELTQIPVLLQSSYWEYLHIWSMRLVSSEPGRGLIESQILAQLTHVFFGYLGSAILVYELIRRRLNQDPLTAAVSALLAVSMRDLLWVSFLAKNDWGVCVWLLAGLNLSFSGSPFLGGIFLGCAVFGKLTNAYLVLALIAAFVVVQRPRVQALAVLLSGSILAGLPYLSRNFLMTRNPVFPFYDRFFQSGLLSLSWRSTYDFYEGFNYQIHLNEFFLTLGRFFSLDGLYLAPLILAPLAVYRHKLPRAALGWLVAALIALIFLTHRSARFEFRHLNCLLVILAMLVPVVIQASFEGLIPDRYLRFLLLPIAFWGVLQSDVIFPGNYGDLPLIQAPLAFYESARPDIAIREEHRLGLAHAWLRMNAKPENASVRTLGNNQQYYISQLSVASFEDDIALNYAVFKNEENLFKSPALSQVDYLVYLAGAEPAQLMARIAQEVHSHPEIVVFSSANSQIMDLRLLRKALP